MTETPTTDADEKVDQTDEVAPESPQEPAEAPTDALDAPEAAEEPADDEKGIEASAQMVQFAASGHGLLTVDPDQRKWTPEQRIALTAIGIPTVGDEAVPPGYVAQFLHVCQSAGLDPWRKEAYLITYGKRFVKDNGQVVDNRKHSLVIGIDGFRKRGEETGEYRGQIGPQWAGEDGQWREFWAPKWGNPVAARVGIMREGFDAPVYGVVMYDEMVAMVDEYAWNDRTRKREKTGKRIPTESWQRMPALMLAKCAEASAFRKAFPRSFSGMYATEEMHAARAEHEQSEREFKAQQRREAIRAAQQRAETAPPLVVPGEVAEPVAVADVVGEVVGEMKVGGDDAQRLLWAEFEWQAETLGQKPAALGKRQVAKRRKNVEDFTAEELLPMVRGFREMAANAAQTKGDPLAAAYAAAATATAGPIDLDALTDAAADADEDPEVVEAEVIPDPADVAPHVYVGNDSGSAPCFVCNEARDDSPKHTTSTDEEAGQ